MGPEKTMTEQKKKKIPYGLANYERAQKRGQAGKYTLQKKRNSDIMGTEKP